MRGLKRSGEDGGLHGWKARAFGSSIYGCFDLDQVSLEVLLCNMIWGLKT